MSKKCNLINSPWWIRVPVGIFLLLPILVFTVGSLSIFGKKPTEEVNIFMLYTLGIAMVCGCLSLFIMNVKMMFGKPPAPNGFSPLTLRVGGVLLLFLPLSGFHNGYYEKEGIAAIIQALFYVFCGLGLFKLASKKSKSKGKSIDANA